MLEGKHTLRKITWVDQLMMVLASNIVFPVLVLFSSGTIISVVLSTQGASVEEVEQFISTHQGTLMGIGFVGTLIATGFVLYFRKIPIFNRKQLSKKEWVIIPGIEKKDWKFLAWYIPATFIPLTIGNVVMQSLFEDAELTNQEAIIEGMESQPLWVMAVLILLVGPLVEEFVLRGVFFFRKEESNDVSWVTLIVTSIFFALIHTPTSIPAVYSYLGMGLLFGYAAKRTKSMEVAIVYHFLNNLIAFVSLLVML